MKNKVGYLGPLILFSSLVGLFVVASCTDKTPVEKVNQKVDSKQSKDLSEEPNHVFDEKAAEKANQHCAVLKMGSAEAVEVWKMRGGHELVICHLADYHQNDQVSAWGWINIYPAPVSLKGGFISEVNSELQSSQITFKIEKVSDEKAVVTKFIKDPKSSPVESFDTAATQFEIDCTDKGCQKSKEVCVFEAPTSRGGDSKLLDFVESIASGLETNLEKMGYYDTVIDKLMNMALRGNNRAIQIVLKTDREKLGVDGAAGESYSDGYRVVKNLHSLGCIK